jgi:hypothetical protein
MTFSVLRSEAPLVEWLQVGGEVAINLFSERPVRAEFEVGVVHSNSQTT